jgi:hypothetical protein
MTKSEFKEIYSNLVHERQAEFKDKIATISKEPGAMMKFLEEFIIHQHLLLLDAILQLPVFEDNQQK